MDPDDTPIRPPQRPGRLAAAIAWIRGEPVVASQIRAEWAAWAWELEGLCEKVTAAAGRVYARDKRELDKALKRVAELEDEGCSELPAVAGTSSARWALKADLGRRMAALKGGTLPEPPSMNGQADVDGAEGQ